jgi:hypothetical protein
MNKRIKELAEQAGCVLHGLVWVANDEDFERFAELVRQDERERIWVGLTDKEISLVLDKNTWASGYASWGQFAKDIEAKLKERNT